MKGKDREKELARDKNGENYNQNNITDEAKVFNFQQDFVWSWVI